MTNKHKQHKKPQQNQKKTWLCIRPVQGIPRLSPDDCWDRLQPPHDPTDGVSRCRKWIDGWTDGLSINNFTLTGPFDFFVYQVETLLNTNSTFSTEPLLGSLQIIKMRAPLIVLSVGLSSSGKKLCEQVFNLTGITDIWVYLWVHVFLFFLVYLFYFKVLGLLL